MNQLKTFDSYQSEAELNKNLLSSEQMLVNKDMNIYQFTENDLILNLHNKLEN